MTTTRRTEPVHGGRLLLALLGAPVAWTAHLLAGYVIVAVWCSGGWRGIGTAMTVLTVACMVAAVASGVLAFRLWREGQHALTKDEEPGTPESWAARMGERGARAAFLAVLALFMAVLFTYLIVLQGLPLFFTPPCYSGTAP